MLMISLREGSPGQRLPYFVCFSLSEFLEDHHQKEVLDTHLFLLKCGGSFDLPKKTAVSAQLFIVALTKATSLVRSFSDLCSLFYSTKDLVW